MLTKKILLIDDNQAILEAYEALLIHEGFHVDSAETGEKGMEILMTHNHHIVITDIKFPPGQMDGFKIIAESKRLNPDCEVIVITGYSDLDLAIKAMHLDASDFVPKPCRKEDLMVAIKRASEKQEMKRLVREYTETLKNMVDKKDQEMANIEERLIHTAKLTAMGEMAASICHELRQPLCGIMGFTYLAAEDIPDNTMAKEYLKKVEEQISRMEQIVNNIRIFSRKSNSCFAPLSINEVVHSASFLFSHQFRNHGIELIEDLGTDIPPIIGNKVKLQQVIINLLSNARDALDDHSTQKCKRVVIKTAYDPMDQKVEVSVTDNGIGIDKSVRDKIFQSFFTTKEEERGTGLGLSVSKSIVSDHEGEIEVKSQIGRGSTFRVILPIMQKGKEQKDTQKDTGHFLEGGGEMGVALLD